MCVIDVSTPEYYYSCMYLVLVSCIQIPGEKNESSVSQFIWNETSSSNPLISFPAKTVPPVAVWKPLLGFAFDGRWRSKTCTHHMTIGGDIGSVFCSFGSLQLYTHYSYTQLSQIFHRFLFFHVTILVQSWPTTTKFPPMLWTLLFSLKRTPNPRGKDRLWRTYTIFPSPFPRCV